jgi:hypothetical protein
MIPTHCPKCNSKLITDKYWSNCQKEDHTLFFNLRNKGWYFELGKHFIGYNSEKYYFGIKNCGEIIYLDPLFIEQAPAILNKCAKLILFL